LKTSGERKKLVPTWGSELFVGAAPSYLLSDLGLRQLPIRQASVRFLIVQLQLARDANRLFHAHNTHDADIIG
jgi:hypothetical protein